MLLYHTIPYLPSGTTHGHWTCIVLHGINCVSVSGSDCMSPQALYTDFLFFVFIDSADTPQCLFVWLYYVCLLWTGTYLETDFDRSATRDISIHSRSNAARGMMSQRSAAAERPLSDAPNKPSRAGHDQSPYRQSQVSSAGYSGLTGGRFPAYRGSTPQSPVRSSQSEQQPQWYDQNSRHPNTAASSSYVPGRTGSNENVHRRHPVIVASYSAYSAANCYFPIRHHLLSNMKLNCCWQRWHLDYEYNVVIVTPPHHTTGGLA